MGNIFGTTCAVGAWGYFIYQGVIDPLGGINTLWPLFGLSNQILAVIALIFITTILLKMGKKKYIWTTFLPLILMIVVTFITALQKIFNPDPSIGFFAHARKYYTALKSESLLQPAQTVSEMNQIITNDIVNGIICCIFLIIATTVLWSGSRIWIRILRGKPYRQLQEGKYVDVNELS